jgi:hypothetical protein
LQVHVQDGAYGARGSSDLPPGHGNWIWAQRDDVTELYFRDWAHLSAVFGSEHVKTVVGPDGLNFSDIETPITMLVDEKRVHFGDDEASKGHSRAVAMYTVTSSDASKAPADVEAEITPQLVKHLAKQADRGITGLLVNTRVDSDRFDLRKYFGGQSMPTLTLVYKIIMTDLSDSSQAAVRSAQIAFENGAGSEIDPSLSMILFGKEGLILADGIPVI